MKITEVRQHTAREQKILLNKIATRRQRIAAMQTKIAENQAEIVKMQAELNMVASENIAWWDCHVPTDFTDPAAEGCSDLNIPLPSAPIEKILVNSRGSFTSFVEVTR